MSETHEPDVAARQDELRILESIRRVIRAIDLYSKRLVAVHGVTVPQLVCLNSVVSDGPLTMSDLSRRVHISASTAVGIVDRLERGGWVRRNRDGVDRRRVMVEATESGRELLERAPSPLQDRVSGGLGRLTPRQRANIARSLERLVELMEAEDLDAAPILETGPLTRRD